MKQVRDTKEFSTWYNDVIYKAELVDESPVKGCSVIRPYGWAIWENIVQELDRRIKDSGAKNAYFPLFIPESFLAKEKEHVEGFSPELAVVTHAGGKELEEKLVVRPTSETVFYNAFSRWISSYRDLPLKINQWANVVRWEMRTRPFLRTAEFMWQEGHTAHETHEEALAFAKQQQQMYIDMARDFLAIPVYAGPKTDSEKFAGADTTLTLEAMMQDGKALQLCTSHLLAHSFPEAYGVQFQDKDGKMQTPWCTSWGWTTRSVGALIMVHGDENGLVMPPRAAPIQVMVVPIFKTEEQKTAVYEYANKMVTQLKEVGIRAEANFDETKTPGNKFFQSELQGIPVRLEVGPRDLESESCMMVCRVDEKVDGRKPKTPVKFDQLSEVVAKTLNQIHDKMLAKAQGFLESNTFEADSYSQLTTEIEKKRGFYKVYWCGNSACEESLKQIQASARVVIGSAQGKKCFSCANDAKTKIIVAKSY